MEQYATFDLSSLTIRRSPDGKSVSVFSRSDELLALLDLHPAWSVRESALRAFDATLKTGCVLRFVDGEVQPCRVALYNPETKEVAVGALPDTVSYTDGEPLDCQSSGILLALSENDALEGLGRTLPRKKADSFAALTRVVLAHSS